MFGFFAETYSDSDERTDKPGKNGLSVLWLHRKNTSTKLHNSQTLKSALRTGQHTGRDAQSVSSAVVLYLAQVFVNNQSPFFRQTEMFPGIYQKERVLVVDGCLEETLNGVIREIAAQIYKDE